MELKGFLKRLDKRLVVLMVLLSLVSIAGCSGGSSSSSASGNTISGTVTLNGLGLSGVTVTVQSNGTTTTITGSGGGYSAANINNGIYTITPSLTGYTFSPTSSAVVVKGGNVTVPNFAATTGANTRLSGTYNMVSFDKTNPSVVAGTLTFTPDATNPTSGTWTGAGNQMSLGGQTVSVSGSGFITFSATESSAGFFTLTPTTAFGATATTASQCIMSGDSNTIVCAKVADTADQYSLIAVKAGTGGLSNASLHGTYYMAVFNQNPGPNAQFGTLTCDGNGGFFYSGTQSNSSGANQGISQSGTYSVANAGMATFTPTSGVGISCGMSADANTLVCAATSTANVQIGVAVKAGSGGFSNASLNGAYYASYLNSLSPFSSGWLIGTFDGNGNFLYVGVQGNSVGASQSVTGSALYPVNVNGTFTIGPNGGQMQCGMSTNTNTLVCAEIDKVAEQSINIFIK